MGILSLHDGARPAAGVSSLYNILRLVINGKYLFVVALLASHHIW